MASCKTTFLARGCHRPTVWLQSAAGWHFEDQSLQVIAVPIAILGCARSAMGDRPGAIGSMYGIYANIGGILMVVRLRQSRLSHLPAQIMIQ